MLTPLSTGIEGISLGGGSGKSTPDFQVLQYIHIHIHTHTQSQSQSQCTQTYTQVVDPVFVPKKTYELLNRITSNGLQAHYRFTRRPHISSNKLLGIEITFQNTRETALADISIGDTRLQAGMSMRDASGVSQLAPGSDTKLTVGVDFNDTLQPAKFDIW